MVFDIPFNVLVLYVGLTMSIGMLGLIMAFKKIAGAPFITVSAGILLFALIVLIDNIEVDYVEEPIYSLEYVMNVTTGTSNVPFSATVFGIAERVANTNSVLYGKPISCVIIDLSKTLNPTGTVKIGVLDSSNIMIKQFGSISASNITTTQRAYTFCLSNHDYYILSLYDYVGVMHTTSTGTDFIKVHVDTTNPFDGNNSVRSVFGTAWVDTSTNDLRMKLITEKLDIIGQPVLHNFNDTDTWAFIIFIAMLFIVIGSMVQFTKW